MKNKNSKGFTIIELLVVIAIIGILASIVMVSLSSARKRAADSKLKSQLASAKVDAEVFYNQNDKYMGVCDPSQGNLWKYTLPGDQGGNCSDNDDYYSISAPLQSEDKCWCVDSSGYQGLIPKSGTACATANEANAVYKCVAGT